jgi:two-component system, NtrC family, response regulator AtoC
MKQIKVLIVDDEELVVAGIKKGLENTDFLVKTVIGGKDAVKLLAKEFFDVVIVDLIMPGFNGVETCMGIKKVSPKTEVLLISGFPTQIEKQLMNFINAGGKDLFLRKPLLADEIKDAIYKILERDSIKE